MSTRMPAVSGRHALAAVLALAAMPKTGLTQTTTTLDLRSQARNVDFSGAASTKPFRSGLVLPALCSAGETYFLAAGAGSGVYLCSPENNWTPLGGTAASVQGNAIEAGTPNSAGQFYGWDPYTSRLSIFTPGPLLSIAGRTINVATESVPQYASSATVPASCDQYGVFHFLTGAASGRKLYYCNGATYEPVSGSGGLSDPGANGLVKRTASDTTAAAVPGTDYYAPGTQVATADLPNPTTSSGGKVQAKSCAAGAFVQSINTDSTVACGTPDAGVRTTQANTYTAGARQTFQPSATTAGARILCGPLPGNPAAGDLACDSADGNKLKSWTGSAWTAIAAGGGSGSGLSDPGSNGFVVRTSGGTVARALAAGSANVTVTAGDGSANPVIDLGSTIDLRQKSTLPNQVGLSANLPATCAVGQTYFKSDAAAGQNLAYCTTPNTWTLPAGGGGESPARSAPYVNTTDVGTSADTAENTLMSYSLPASTLSANGQFIRIQAWGTAAPNSPKVSLWFGATRIVLQHASNNSNWSINCTVVRTGASLQYSTCATVIGWAVGSYAETTTPTESTSGAILIRATGQNGTASSGQVTQKGMIVETRNF